MDKTGEDWIATSLRPDPSVRSGRESALGQAHVGILCNKPSRIEPKTPAQVRRDQTPPCFSERTAPFFSTASCSLLDKIRERNRALLVGAVSFCDAGQSVTLTWDRNAEQDIANYRLYYGTQSGRPSQSLGVGNVTTATITNLNDGTTYFFAIAAVNTVGLEGPLSNEVSYTTPNPAAHVLTVNSGSGNGSYVAGTIVTVSANAPPAGKEFDRWLDDWVILSNPWMATTTATMHIRMSRLRRWVSRASSRHSYWKKFRCLHCLVLVSCVGHSLPHCGHPNFLRSQNPTSKPVAWAPLQIDIPQPSTYASSCRAAVNNASGVIAPILFPLDRDLKGRAMRPLFLVCRALLARLIKIKSSPSTNSQQRGAMFTLRRLT